MDKVMKSLSDFNLTIEEVKEYEKLKTAIFGKRYSPTKSLFVILDETDPKVIRYNELAIKMVPLLAYAVMHHQDLTYVPGDATNVVKSVLKKTSW